MINSLSVSSAIIIPARGGSKRIPKKNIREFCGQPMISWAISNALNTNTASSVYVSTDDPDIAEIASKSGASVPFLREPQLSDDFTPTIPVIQNFIERLVLSDKVYDHYCCLYPTTPLLNSEYLTDSFSVHIARSSLQYLTFSAIRFSHPIQRAFYISDSNQALMYNVDNYNSRTQDLLPSYFDAGQFYWGSKEAWLNCENMIHHGTPYILPSDRIQDIDTLEDWYSAESKFRQLHTH